MFWQGQAWHRVAGVDTVRPDRGREEVTSLYRGQWSEGYPVGLFIHYFFQSWKELPYNSSINYSVFMHIPLKAKLEFSLSHLLFGRFVNVDKAFQKESTDNYKSSNNKPSYQTVGEHCAVWVKCRTLTWSQSKYSISSSSKALLTWHLNYYHQGTLWSGSGWFRTFTLTLAFYTSSTDFIWRLIYGCQPANTLI